MLLSMTHQSVIRFHNCYQHAMHAFTKCHQMHHDHRLLQHLKPGHIPCWAINALRPRQNGCHLADNIFKRIFLNENIWIPIEISLKFVPKGSINNIPALIQIMAWRRPGDKPLSEPMMVNLRTHICITQPQWVNLIALSPHLRTLSWNWWFRHTFNCIK